MSAIDYKVTWLKERLEIMARDIEQAEVKIEALLELNRQARAKYKSAKDKFKPFVKER